MKKIIGIDVDSTVNLRQVALLETFGIFSLLGALIPLRGSSLDGSSITGIRKVGENFVGCGYVSNKPYILYHL